jgi:hypothetical protein
LISALAKRLFRLRFKSSLVVALVLLLVLLVAALRLVIRLNLGASLVDVGISGVTRLLRRRRRCDSVSLRSIDPDNDTIISSDSGLVHVGGDASGVSEAVNLSDSSLVVLKSSLRTIGCWNGSDCAIGEGDDLASIVVLSSGIFIWAINLLWSYFILDEDTILEDGNGAVLVNSSLLAVGPPLK